MNALSLGMSSNFIFASEHVQLPFDISKLPASPMLDLGDGVK